MDVEAEMEPAPVPKGAEELYAHLQQRLASHRSSAVKRNVRYKRASALFGYTIPLLALTLTILIAAPLLSDDRKIIWCGIAASVLTIMSSVNAVMRPVERYQSYATACMSIQRITFELQRGLRERSRAEEEEVLTFLGSINEQVTHVGEQMASLPALRPTL